MPGRCAVVAVGSGKTVKRYPSKFEQTLHRASWGVWFGARKMAKMRRRTIEVSGRTAPGGRGRDARVFQAPGKAHTKRQRKEASVDTIGKGMKHQLEKHSVNTLAHRFKGLASRNTITAWLKQGKLKPEMQDATAAPFLFTRKHLDAVADLLSRAHDERVERLTANPRDFKHIRDTARQNALTIIRENQILESGKRPMRREKDLATNDCDAVGGVRLCADGSMVRKMGNCTITGSSMKGKLK